MSDAESWAGRRVLVTGAASGVGRATALAFVERSAEVVALDKDGDGLADLATVPTRERAISTIRCDLADAADIARAFAEAGPLNAAANVAGIGQRPTTIEELDLKTIDAILSVNVRSMLLCMQHEIRLIRQRGGGGAIVNVSSGGGFRGAPGLSAYIASKHAVIGLTRSVAAEVAREGIRVNVVCPGALDTPMFRAAQFTPAEVDRIARSKPLGRLGRPEEIAEAIVWAAGDRASYMAGAVLAVDGGFSAI
ncbi:MAG: Short-chain dehydrogenase/reductase [Bradyrhizobium sp.]|nr:Short-chain dehydrogenase/reductase [Bradyrhizobium sp.]